jgi:hypothetical protein
MSFAALLLLALASGPEQVLLDRTLDTPLVGRLLVTSAAGTVEVTTWDRSAVRVRAIGARGNTVRAESMASGVRVIASPSAAQGEALRLEITVPSGFDLEVLGGRTRVRIEEAGGSVLVRNQEGAIEIRGGLRTIVARTIAGPITVDKSAGALIMSSATGDLRASACIGSLEASTVSGRITLQGLEVERLQVTSISGSIGLEGDLPAGSTGRLTSHSGELRLDLPSTVSLTLETRTASGQLSLTLPPAETDDVDSGWRRARYGAGEATLELETFNGNIQVRRLPNGALSKEPKP